MRAIMKIALLAISSLLLIMGFAEGNFGDIVVHGDPDEGLELHSVSGVTLAFGNADHDGKYEDGDAVYLHVQTPTNFEVEVNDLRLTQYDDPITGIPNAAGTKVQNGDNDLGDDLLLFPNGGVLVRYLSLDQSIKYPDTYNDAVYLHQIKNSYPPSAYATIQGDIRLTHNFPNDLSLPPTSTYPAGYKLSNTDLDANKLLNQDTTRFTIWKDLTTGNIYLVYDDNAGANHAHVEPGMIRLFA